MNEYLLVASIYIIALAFSAILGIIPGVIAKNKGYSFALWWFYGWMFFMIALIHSILIPDKNETKNGGLSAKNISEINAAEELKTYKELLDQGVISEKEFNIKKEQLIKLI